MASHTRMNDEVHRKCAQAAHAAIESASAAFCHMGASESETSMVEREVSAMIASVALRIWNA